MGKVTNSFIFNNPTKIFFGVGKLGMLHTEPLPGKKALLLTSVGSSHFKNGSFEKTIKELELSNIKYLHLPCISENPLREEVNKAGLFAKKHKCDFIVALGGGAVLDAAVGVSIVATNGNDIWDYVTGGSGKGLVAKNKPLPIVTIATTSGTGSEINESTVLSNDITKEKVGISDRRCKPVLAIVDPAYMITVPPKYTAFQGFDAFFHHEEVLMSKRCNVMSEMIALDSISRLWHYLPIAVKEGNNLEAREEVAFAATMSGITMQLTRITAQHSLEHGMSAYYRNLPHGAGLIIISIEYARFFLNNHACDDAFIKMARVMGYPNTNDPSDFIKALEKLIVSCGVQSIKMSDYGIKKSDLVSFIKKARAVAPAGFEVTPCDLNDADALELLNKSYK